jgi:hypothetical protein
MVGDDNKGENAAAASGPEKPISYKSSNQRGKGSWLSTR